MHLPGCCPLSSVQLQASKHTKPNQPNNPTIKQTNSQANKQTTDQTSKPVVLFARSAVEFGATGAGNVDKQEAKDGALTICVLID
jgi:beta-lactam-binding protein with PASTA domain